MTTVEIATACDMGPRVHSGPDADALKL